MLSSASSPSTLVAIRAAYHPEVTPAYDRVVFEFSGPVPLLRVEYVQGLVADGSGKSVPIAGQAILQVRMEPAHAHDEHGTSTAPLKLALNLPLVRAIVGAGDFEGIVTYGIGLQRKVETRILTLAGASRLVIDFLQI
jgi:hypothetical protein